MPLDGVHITKVSEEVHVTTLRTTEAQRFELEAGAPALALERLASAGEQPVEHRVVLAPSTALP